MANQHKLKGRYLRGVTDEDWEAFGVAAAAAGTDRSAIVREFIGWYLWQASAQLPERSPAPAADA
jgi:hypothetical protein